jgi:hypothetical protein
VVANANDSSATGKVIESGEVQLDVRVIVDPTRTDRQSTAERIKNAFEIENVNRRAGGGMPGVGVLGSGTRAYEPDELPER